MFHKFVIIIISGWVLASFWGFRPMLSNTSYAKHQYWQRHCWMASSGAPTRPRLPWLPFIKSVFSQSKLFKNSKSLSLSIETFCKTHITYHHIMLVTFLFPRMACDQWFTTWSIWCKTWMSLRCSPERWSALSSSSTLAQSCTPFWYLSWTFSGRISFLGHQIILYKSIPCCSTQIWHRFYEQLAFHPLWMQFPVRRQCAPFFSTACWHSSVSLSTY